MGSVIFIFTVRFMRILEFNRKIMMLVHVMHLATKPLITFCFVFSVYFFAFAQLGYLLLYRNVDSFSSIIRASESLCIMALGQ